MHFPVRSLAVAAPVLGPALPASATTFQITMAGQTTSFDAPPAGGAISNLSISGAGITFDTARTGAQTPVYDPLDSDIDGSASQFGNCTNSVARGNCAVSQSLREFEDSNMGLPPKL